jgi:hypothetical protein
MDIKMKTKLYLLLLVQLLCFEIWAGSISGTISYAGIFNQTIYIAIFSNPDLDGDPLNVITINQPGSYTITDISDGTYYLVSVMTASTEDMLFTDPYGFWGNSNGFTPIIITDDIDVTDINVTLIDGTEENPNPFAENRAQADETTILPNETIFGVSPTIAYDGKLIYLYKQNFNGSDSAKIFKVYPTTGEIVSTHNLNLTYLPNGICWIDNLTLRNGELWASGGYGSTDGLKWIEGIFKVDVNTSSASSQIPFSDSVSNQNGFACDGTNFYIGIETNGKNGILKFNPDNITSITLNYFIDLDDAQVREISYSNNSLWVGLEKLIQFSSIDGSYIENYELPGYVAELCFSDRFWSYNETKNTFEAFLLSTVDINNGQQNECPNDFSLSQNYPNPFNPTTIISYSLPSPNRVSLIVYDVLGNEIKTLVDEVKSAGNYEIKFEGGKLTSGIYFYRLLSGELSVTKKMILMK